jgi:hypothetical protein
MTRNQQIMFIGLIVALFAGLSIGVIASQNSEPETMVNADRSSGVIALLDEYARENDSGTVWCYVNSDGDFGPTLKKVPCTPELVRQQKQDYENHVQHGLDQLTPVK